MKKININFRFMLIGIGFSILYWILESGIHVFIFDEGVMMEQLFAPNMHEIWMRLLTILMIILLVSYAQYMIIRLNKEKNTIKLLHLELDQIFNTAADGMRLIDKHYNVLRINRTLSKMSGISMQEATRKKCYETFHGSLCRTDRCTLRRVLQGETQVECDAEKERKDGEKISCIVTATPFRDPDGELIGIVEDFKDITARKIAEKELASRAEELARSNSELQQFAYVASHDLQEPLRMVVSYMQLLSNKYKGKLDNDADDYIYYAIDGSMRMQKLIKDLLAYSRVGTKGKDFKPTESIIALDEAVSNLQAAIKETHAIITHDALPKVIADNSQLVQLFQNLLSNAIKFRGEKPPCIHISAEKKISEYIFSVQDNGIGINTKYAGRIFAVFQRLHSRSEYPGTGIGLAICKKIVERHGGTIWVESESGKGSIFNFTIPNQQV
ncbi:MAG: ATP-binding protein [bacterium]